jgi:hypothetical protein
MDGQQESSAALSPRKLKERTATIRGEWQVAIVQPKNFSTLQWLATRYWKFLMFSVCVVAVLYTDGIQPIVFYNNEGNLYLP